MIDGILAGHEVGRLALSLDRFLDHFAARHQSHTWKDLVPSTPEFWRYEFLRLMDETACDVYFNLREVELGTGLLRAASGKCSNTGWELLMIREHPEWWGRIHWFDDERPVDNPFATIANGD